MTPWQWCMCGNKGVITEINAGGSAHGVAVHACLCTSTHKLPHVCFGAFSGRWPFGEGTTSLLAAGLLWHLHANTLCPHEASFTQTT